MCKHVFVQKTNAGRQSNKANASVEILIAIALLRIAFFGVCIATKQKREQFAKHVFVTKTTKRIQKICTKKDG